MPVCTWSARQQEAGQSDARRCKVETDSAYRLSIDSPSMPEAPFRSATTRVGFRRLRRVGAPRDRARGRGWARGTGLAPRSRDRRRVAGQPPIGSRRLTGPRRVCPATSNGRTADWTLILGTLSSRCPVTRTSEVAPIPVLRAKCRSLRERVHRTDPAVAAGALVRIWSVGG